MYKQGLTSGTIHHVRSPGWEVASADDLIGVGGAKSLTGDGLKNKAIFELSDNG